MTARIKTRPLEMHCTGGNKKLDRIPKQFHSDTPSNAWVGPRAPRTQGAGVRRQSCWVLYSTAIPNTPLHCTALVRDEYTGSAMPPGGRAGGILAGVEQRLEYTGQCTVVYTELCTAH